MTAKKKIFQKRTTLAIVVIVSLIIGIATTPSKKTTEINTYEECVKLPNTTGGIDPNNHKPVCAFEDGRKYFKTSSPTVPPTTEWRYISPRVYGSDEIFPFTSYNFKSPSMKIGPGVDGWSNIIFYENGYNYLDYAVMKNKQNSSLESFIANFHDKSNEGINLTKNITSREKILVNNIQGYKILTNEQIYTFLKDPRTTQIMIFHYKNDPNWYSHPDLIKIIENIISTSEYEPNEN